jgi:hypothetical protein
MAVSSGGGCGAGVAGPDRTGPSVGDVVTGGVEDDVAAAVAAKVVAGESPAPEPDEHPTNATSSVNPSSCTERVLIPLPLSEGGH